MPGRSILLILGLALCLRLAIALSFQNIIAPDEIYQSLEQAHRLVYGQGVIPWEFQVGLRCWLIPLLLAVPMAAVNFLHLSPLAGLIIIRILLCLASLPIVFCAAAWGQQTHGARGAMVAGLFTACWPDLWLLAPHPLEEVFAADCLVPAVYLISRATTPGRIAAAAFLLGLAFTFRIQLAPAIAIAGIALCKAEPRRWLIALPIAALPVLAAGLLDWLSWGQPFRSFWLNIYLNLHLGIAAQEFGASPANYFVGMLALDWLWTLPFFLFLAWRGASRQTLPAIMALVILLTHTLIGHKEFRFIFPAMALAVPLAGIGFAAFLSCPRRIPAAALLLAGPLASPFLYFMLNWQTVSFQVFEAAAAQHPPLVSVANWDRSFLPIDLVFGPVTSLTAGPAAITIATSPPADAIRKECFKSSWIPLAAAKPDICIWQQPDPPATPLVPFTLPFPAAARHFIVRDGFTDK